MASFNDKRRGDSPKRRVDDPRRRRQSVLAMELLENRRLLTGGGVQGPGWHPTDSNPLNPLNGPLANLGTDVVKAYGQYLSYVAAGSKGTFKPTTNQPVETIGNDIGLDVRGFGDFNTYKTALTSLGFIVTATVPKYDYIEGYIPYGKLPQVAEQAQTIGGQPIYKPFANTQGISPNQADVAVNVATARTTFGINGAGQKLGVLSTDDGFTDGLINNSIKTGDLPANVQTIDDTSGTTDGEGRAMLEQIYDLDPGAALAYATAFNGEASFAANIQKLYNAGATTLVDDIGYFLDPFYQDGIIQQSVNTVVASGANYLSSVGNTSDSGYESQFRPVTATVGTLGTGTYMNFDPTGATQATMIGINVYTPGTGIVLQFDQPFYTTAGVSSNVEIDVLDQQGNIVQQANMNNVAVQQPTQITGGLAAGLYNVVIKVDSGPSPGHVVFYATGDGGFSVDTKYGSAGGTYYPSTTGHNSGAQTISTGAVPFWSTPNYVHTPSLDTNEPFSSTGPVLKVFNPDGSRMATPTLLLKPDLSATDGNNTSFFGQPVNTTQQVFPVSAPYPGDPVTTFADPVTPTNQSVGGLPNFFGTSSAAPNLAAIVALMKEVNPGLTHAEVVQDLISTTTSLDGIPAGTWNKQAGYGLVNALAAVNAAQQLKVLSIVPGGNSTITTIPTFLTVTFSQGVAINTLSAANLLVVPTNGASVVVGQPIGVDSPTFPSVVEFPITIMAAPGRSGNGLYRDAIIGPGITSVNGKPLSAPYADQFNIQDVNGPRVSLTTYFGRIVTIAFNQALNPSTVTPSNIYLFRSGGAGATILGPNAVVVSALPGATFVYNPINFTVQINLTNVAQSSLPTDHYGLVISNAVSDELNNPLNGFFSGVFPSGTNPEGAGGSVFLQDLGLVNLQAPIISYLALAANSDTGIPGDNNTADTVPNITGQVTATFPGTVSGLLVYAEFNGIVHTGVLPGGLDLGLGSGGRGFVGHFDVQTTTNAVGQFTVNYPPGVTPLPDGLNRIRVVVLGAPDIPPLPGFSAVQDTSFRVDTTDPVILPQTGVVPSILPNATINNLSNLQLNFADPVNPTTIGSPFAVPATFNVPALNPTTAGNVSSYGLFLLNAAGLPIADESGFITSATFVTIPPARVLTSDPFLGQVNLTFAPGLPAGSYGFLVRSSLYGAGVSDAAGNPFIGGPLANYLLNFTLQPTPSFISNYMAFTPDATTSAQYDVTGPRATYELPVSGVPARAFAPPTLYALDFSNSLMAANAAGVPIDYSTDIQLVRSADSAISLPDGNFGDLGQTNTTGFTAIAGITVTLTNSVPGAVKGQYGYNNRLLIGLPAGFTLPADYYRLYVPNSGTQAIFDIFGNQLDGEFLGYQDSTGKYVDKLQNGTIRGSASLPDLSGDGNPGGAFMTGFVVVPNGNVIYANADAIYNPLIPAETPNGSAARPYPVLAPEAVPNPINGGDLNSSVNSGANFNPIFDRSGDGQFEPSAFFAAQSQLALNGGPVAIIAEASVPSRDPITGGIVQKPFVLQAPNPSGGQAATIANDASAAVPALTTLELDPGVIVKMQNAALLIQNQGSALQINGGPNSYSSVIITSYKDSTVGGVTNGDPKSTALPGDYGGIVFRNFSQAALPGETVARSDLFPGQIPITGISSEDQRLKGQFADLTNPQSQVDAISGADDVMSSIAFLTERYAGGVVPQTIGTQYDGITLLNSRPAIVDSTISDAGGAGSAVAGLSANVDSLRSDDVAQGPLVRNDVFLNNGLNGIYIRANTANGVAEATDAVLYPTNAASLGGSANYVLNNPYPYLFTSRVEIGERLTLENGAIVNNTDRLYVIPGSLLKFETGAFLEIGQEDQAGRAGFGGSNTGQGTAASLVVGDPTYAREYDANNAINPGVPGFRANSNTLAKVEFTTFADNSASTFSIDPLTQIATTIVAPLATQPASATLPPPTKASWGGIQLDAGSRDTINDAIFAYGGGFINTSAGASTLHAIDINPFDNAGAFVSITNNIFFDNADVPINTSPDAWLGTNLQEPLNSGAPFIHGNLFIGNDYNGVGVTGGTTQHNISNDDFNSVWTGGDFTYFLRSTIVLGPQPGPGFGAGGIPQTPSGTVLQPTPTPNVTLTLQSTLPTTIRPDGTAVAGSLLADGSVVASPGVPLVVKLLNDPKDPQVGPPPETLGVIPAAAIANSFDQGAGFVVGIDNNIDPPADPNTVIDSGAFSELRIVGIAANQTTGQARVPVIITSAFNDTVGTTVNGVQLTQLIPGNTTTPHKGDGGVIYFGGNSLTSYNLTDPRSGSIIDNADISDITRVEQQGGGIVYGFDLTGKNAFTPAYSTLFGLPQGGGILGNPLNFADQYNAPKAITVSNSNFSNFSSVGFYAHPSTNAILIPVNFTSQLPYFRGTNFNGEPTHDYFVNDTFSNMPTGVYILSQAGADIGNSGPYPTPAVGIFLNDSFFNDPVGIHTNGQGTGQFSHVALLAMDSIFDGSSTSAVITDGFNYGGTQNEGQNNVVTIIPGQLVYDDFFGDAATVTGNSPNIAQVSKAIFTDPAFRAPQNGNFFLLPTSSVIDVARSEIGPTIFGDTLYPAVNYATNADGSLNLTTPPIRNEPTFLGFGLDQSAPAGDINVAGGLGYNFVAGGPNGVPYYNDIVTLPGRTYPGSSAGSVAEITYPDQWIQVPIANGTGTQGNAGNLATYAYMPVIGQRDQVGDLRQKDVNSPNIGYGSKPVFDLGAFEYIVQNPPVVEAVAATTKNGLSSIYLAGGIAGVNQLPTTVQFLFNKQINPATINGMSVLLQASGGDGVFGNGNSPLDRLISLQGLTSFNPADDVLTVNTSGIFTNLGSASDEYRITLKGTGSSVIRDNTGLALDGFNIDAAGNQLPLPSGSDQFPGSDFQVTFTIDTHPPALVPGTFRLDPASDSSGGLNITNVAEPTFDGSITDTFPPVNFLQGQTVFIDVSTRGDGVFNLLNAGVGFTDINGNFKVTLSTPIPNTPQPINGVNGLQEGPGSLTTFVRVRVVDQSGNQSILTNAPIYSYALAGALTGLQEDNVNPRIFAFSPTANTIISPQANGQVVFSTTFSKNLKNSTLNASSVLVFRTGGTGRFATPVQVPIIPGSFTYAYSTNPLTLGDETVTFAISASQPNDEYFFVLKGTGATPITDLAGNPLDGANVGRGSDFSSAPFIIFSASNAHLIYVGPLGTGIGTGVAGTRENPFPTIAQGLAAASIGDDVLVLPGTYEENVTMKAGVRLLSADPASTDTTFFAGSPYQTLIYGVPILSLESGAGNNLTTFFSAGSIFGIPTEVSGFAIISPLLGDSNLGVLDTTDVAVRTLNSNIAIDRNIIVNAGVGLYLSTEGALAQTSLVFDNIIAGNSTGVLVNDLGATTSIVSPAMIVNNTIVDNTIGLTNISVRSGSTQAFVINNIFYSNHDLTTKRTGTGIAEGSAGTLAVGNNLFYQNGPTNAPASNATGTYFGFNPAALSTKPDALGNLLGNPYFVQPEDPRPNGDSPSVFFNYSNFDLTSRSVAINAADGALAPSSDFLYRTPVFIAGHGFPGTGPASIGAFYYKGISGASGGTGVIFTGTGTGTGGTGGTGSGGNGGNAVTSPPFATSPLVSAESISSPTPASNVVGSTVGGGIALGTKQFSVLTTSLSGNGTVQAAGSAGGLVTEPGPSYIDVNFSDKINPATISPLDLLLSGSGLNTADPAHPVSLGWIDDHAVRFYLAGGYNKSGTVTVTIPQGAITDSNGAALVGFGDTFQIGAVTTPTLLPPVAAPVVSTTSVAPAFQAASIAAVVQPVAAAAPVSALSVAGPTAPTHHLTAKEQKALKAAEAKAEKAVKAHEAALAKAQKAAEAKAVKVAKAAAHAAAHKAKKTR